MEYSEQRLFAFFEELIVNFKDVQAMDQTVNQNGVPAIVGIELCMTAAAQEHLALLQGQCQTETQADQPTAGGTSPPGEQLVEVDLTHAAVFGKNGLGNAFFLDKTAEQVRGALYLEAVHIAFQKIVQIGGFCKFLP